MEIASVNFKSICCLALLFFMVANFACPVSAARSMAETESIVQSEKPVVEVMFVLDTTGSMGGLIAAAKEKIWSIANTLASGDPAPAIRMGLVGYRDRGDAYVTTYSPLSEDLDAVYSRLIQFTADGGGDTPESVNQALHEAVTRTIWSQDPAAYRVIFLVGDAPPHMDYQNDIHYDRSCSLAQEKGIIINTIQCGTLSETTPAWKAIARLAQGQYFQVAQSGSAVLYETPYDQKISGLSRALDETRLYYGDAKQLAEMETRQRTADKIYESSAPSAVAKRTIFNTKKAGAKNFIGSQELVSEVASGELDLEKVKEEELPAELKELSPDARKEYVDARIQKRQELQAEIDTLGKKRQAYIAKKVKEEKDSGEKSLDVGIYKCIQTQAAEKNIQYSGGPEY